MALKSYNKIKVKLKKNLASKIAAQTMDQKSMDWKLSAVWITLSLGYVEIRLASGKGDGRSGLTS